jgi:ankyrin repeat protein
MNRFAIAAALIALLLQSCQAIAKSEAKTYFTLVELCASDDATPEAIQEFLDLQVDLNTKDKDENTPLLLCVKRGDIVSAKLLIENGGDVDARNKDGLAALYYARKGKQKELEGVLIRAGAKEHLLWIFVDGRTMFEAARDSKTTPNQFSRHIDAIRKAGADVNAKNIDGKTPLHQAAYFNKNPEVITTLIEAGADVNAKNVVGATPLHAAALINRNPEVLRVLIEAGADVNAKKAVGETPLHTAAAYGINNPETLTFLIQAGADVNAKDYFGKTPLHAAAKWKWNANPEAITLLIKAGADLNAKDVNNWTPLHDAAASNTNPKVITLLIKAGADVNAKDKDGWTPLDRAISPPFGEPKPKKAEALRAAGGKRGKDLP